MSALCEPTDLRPLGVVASAIAGRSVEVVPAEPGSRTWTDGRAIFLEPVPDHRARLRLLAAQASLLAADSLRSDLVRELRRHRPLAERYLAVEGHRALAANEEVLPPWMRSMIDHELASAAPSAFGSLALARRERRLVPSWELGAIDARRIHGVLDREDGLAAGGPQPRVRPGGDTALRELEEDERDEPGLDLGNLLSSPVGGGSALGRLFARLLRPTRARDGGGPPGADAPTHLSRGRPGVGRTYMSRPMPAGEVSDAPPAATATHRYPEWDERRRTYRTDWCHVVEDVAAADGGSSTALPEPVALRHALARLGAGLTPCRRRRQGEDIDIDALVEARVDHLAGHQGDDEVYVEQLRRRRDLSVLVLLDVSGSATEPGVAGRTVHEHQRDAAAALTTVLHRLGDRVALHAFSSRGRTDVRVTTIKGFDEPADGTTSRRLDGLQPGAYTRLGAAIRHGGAVLEASGGTPRRLLVVLSDGFAYDHGYEGRHGEADARRALLEARRRGIGCLCLSVGADVDLAALRRVFGTAAHARVATTADLPATIGPLFAAALRSAEAQRRRFQRTERTRARYELEERRR